MLINCKKLKPGMNMMRVYVFSVSLRTPFQATNSIFKETVVTQHLDIVYLFMNEVILIM